ncbi:MAG TPA: ribosome maturation factor RimP [Candidatus Elarobacter sp.]|nr:ribosome maturation factor RimP [Candidatus Elarobacter sp.]
MDRAQQHRSAPPESLRGRMGGPAHGAGGSEPGAESLFTEAFERVVHALPHQPEFRDVEIVGATVHRHRQQSTLHVTVDREGGVDITTCERIASRINAALDAFPDPYTLEVESAGLNRPLTKPSDYDRFTGRDVKIVTTLAIENAKTHRGKLDGVRGTNVILARQNGELPIPIAVIKSANLEYDVRADLQRAKQREKNR